ncbi:MAG: polyprenol monophosphomannose synthase [Actinobacteria bacterium]|nr:polyprenol monophosphomannose synthase [Actinomycetota bacterium]
MRVLVVTPTYNEAENIGEVVSRARAALPEGEILVADDASPDGTAEVAEAAGAEVGGVHVLRRPGKDGLGPAYKAGFSWAIDHGYDVVVQMDADLQFDPEVIPDLVAEVEAGADYAIGARYIAGGAIPDWPWYRRALSRWGNRYARLMLRLSGHDATSGFRAVRTDLLKRVDYETVRADGYGFLIEMLYRFQRSGARGAEVPITFRDRTHGKSKMSGRIVVEAMWLVSRWGIRDRLRKLRRGRVDA